MIKVAFDDWWEGFDKTNNFITKTLQGNIDYRIVDNPKEADFLFCSIEKKKFYNYKCPRILFTGENYVPNFNFYDYAIGFEHMSFADRYFRYPLYVAYYDEACKLIENKKELSGNECDRNFCSFVVSNSAADSYRVRLFDNLSKYKDISSGGKFRNNIGIPEGVPNKIEFLKNYKFNIACENVSHPGYCTEKIIEAFAAITVPIYWGDPRICEYFNPKAFINCNEFDSIDSVIEHIIKVDKDDDLYMSMLNEPIIISERYSFNKMRDDFKTWLVSIVSQEKSYAYRRDFSGYSYRMEEEYIKFNKMKERKKKSVLKEIFNNKVIKTHE